LLPHQAFRARVGRERKKERKKKNHLSDNSLLLAAQMFQPAVKGRIV